MKNSNSHLLSLHENHCHLIITDLKRKQFIHVNCKLHFIVSFGFNVRRTDIHLHKAPCKNTANVIIIM